MGVVMDFNAFIRSNMTTKIAKKNSYYRVHPTDGGKGTGLLFETNTFNFGGDFTGNVIYPTGVDNFKARAIPPKEKEYLEHSPYCFLTLAHQGEKNKNGDPTFKWNEGFKIKLGEMDIEKMGAAFSGLLPDDMHRITLAGKEWVGITQIYHKTEKQQTDIRLSRVTSHAKKENIGGIHLQVSQKRDGAWAQISFTFNLFEMWSFYENLKKAMNDFTS